MKKDHSWDGFFHLLVEGGGSGANNISYFYCGFSNSSDHKQDRHHEPCRTGVVGFAGVSDVGIGGGKGRIEGNTHYDAAHLAIAHSVACHAAAGLAEEIGIVKESAYVTCLQNQGQPVLFYPAHWICILNMFGKCAAHSGCRPNCYGNGL